MERQMFNWLFKSEKKSKVVKNAAFICQDCGFTCNECELAPLCYGCHCGNDTFCPNCKSKIPKKKAS